MNWSRLLHRLWLASTAIWFVGLAGLTIDHWERVPLLPVATVAISAPLAVLAFGYSVAWAVRGLQAPEERRPSD